MENVRGIFNLSVVIPIGPSDRLLDNICTQLVKVLRFDAPKLTSTTVDNQQNFAGQSQLSPLAAEVIFAAGRPAFEQESEMLQSLVANRIAARWIQTSLGRAVQMNEGARCATGDILWFVHCDTSFEFSRWNLVHVIEFALTHNSLIYFDLKFSEDGPAMCRLNSFFANVRSHLFRLPFGDQAFMMSRRTWEEIGPYDISASYGEDHLLVWAAHHRHVVVKGAGFVVSTSARKYSRNGWWNVSIKHVYLTIRQAVPELLKMIRRMQ